MATQTDLFLAILALDAYNRGYNPGMTFAGSSAAPGTAIGDATIAVALPNASTGFYAVAYQWDGETVISYRGTTFDGLPNWRDVLFGWTLSAGLGQASQAQQALNFYAYVEQNFAGGVGGQDIQLTGHSLGGGLAGFVSDIVGASADVFNNMPFGTGVVAQIVSLDRAQGMTSPAFVFSGHDPMTGNNYEALPSSSAGVRQFITYGEVATGPRASTGQLSLQAFLAQGLDPLTAAALAARGVVLDNSTGISQTLSSNVGSPVSPTNLHSQSLMVLLLYADVNQETAWASIGLQLYSALFNDTIANQVQLSGTARGWYTSSAEMMAEIAYSALESGYMPFGDTGIRSLFADADKLGSLVSAGLLTGILGGYDVQNALAEILVQYAGDQAASGQTNSSFLSGAFSTGGGILSVDLDPSKWTATNSQASPKIAGAIDFADAVSQEAVVDLVAAGADAVEFMFLQSQMDTIEQIASDATKILIALTSAGSVDGSDVPNDRDGDTGGAILIGGNDGGSVTAGDGDNLIIGGSLIDVGDGDNIVIGQVGDETISLGGGNNIVVGGTGDVTVDYTKFDLADDPHTFELKAGTFGQNEVLIVKSLPADPGTEPPPQDDLYDVSSIKFGANADVKIDDISIKVDLQAPDGGTLDFSNVGSAIKSTTKYENGEIKGSDITFSHNDKGNEASSDITVSGFDKLIGTKTADTITIDVPAGSTNSSISKIDGNSGGDTFNVNYSRGSSAPLLIESGGDGDFELNNSDEASFTVLWGGSGGNVYNFNGSTADSSTAVMCITMTGLTEQNFLQLDTSKLKAYLDSAYPRYAENDVGGLDNLAGQNLIVIVNPNQDDILEYNGTKINPVDTDTTNIYDYGSVDFSVHSMMSGPYAVDAFWQYVDQYGFESGDMQDGAGSYEGLLVHNADWLDWVWPAHILPHTGLFVGGFGQGTFGVNTEIPGASTYDPIFGNYGEVGVFGNANSPTLDASAYLPANNGPIDPTVAEFLANQASLDASGQGILISDTASNIASALDVLSSDPNIVVIELTDAGTPTLALASPEIEQYLGTLEKISDQDYAITLTDGGTPTLDLTAAQVSSGIGVLRNITSSFRINVTDAQTPTLTLTAAQFLSGAGVLSAIVNSNISVNVVDSALNVSSQFDALNSSSGISAIILTDTGTPTLSLDASQVTNDSTALALIANAGYDITVHDYSWNVSNYLDALNANSNISSITLIDSDPYLYVAANQANSDIAVLSNIVSNYTLEIDNASVSDAIGVVAATSTLTTATVSVYIDDTWSNIAGNFDQLASLPGIDGVSFSDSQVLSLTASQVLSGMSLLNAMHYDSFTISLIDPSPPTFYLSSSQLAADVDIFARMASGSYSITLTDALPVMLTATQALTDGSVLAAVTNPNYVLGVSDNASNITSNLAALNADSSVQAIFVNDQNFLTLSTAQIVQDAAVIEKISNAAFSIVVADSAANVATNFDALNATGRISTIVFTDSGMPMLGLSSAQLIDGLDLLAVVKSPSYAIQLTDQVAPTFSLSASALSANFETFAAIANSSYLLDLTDSGVPVLEINAYQALNTPQVFNAIANESYSLAIHDSAANIAAQIDALNGDVRVGPITLTDAGHVPVLKLSSQQLNDNISLVQRISNASYAIQLTDTGIANLQLSAAQLSMYADVLDKVSTPIHLTLVDSGSPVVAFDAAQAARGFDITNPSYTVAVTDSAANVSAVFDTLNSNSRISSIALTDTGVPVLNLTAAQARYDITARARITNSAYSIAVVDFAAAVSANFDAIATDSQIESITLSSGGPLFLSAQQAADDAATLNLITDTSYTISVFDNTASVSSNIDGLNTNGNVSAITLIDGALAPMSLTARQALESTQALGKITNSNFSIAIQDTADSVSQNIDALNADTKISSITLIDSGVPTVVVTARQDIEDASVFGEITNLSYGVEIVDTAAAIASNIDQLNEQGAFSSIYLSDTGTPILNLNAAQVADDVFVLSAITNTNYGIVVSDTAENIFANIAALSANTAISSISLVGNDADFTLSVQQALASSEVFAKIASSYTLAIVDGAAALGGLTAAQISVLANEGMTSISCSDNSLGLTIGAAVGLHEAGCDPVLPSGGVVNVQDSAAAIAAITQGQADALATAGYTGITSTTGNVTLSAAAAQILFNDGISIVGSSNTVDFGSVQSSSAVFGFSGGGWAVIVGGETSILRNVERVQFTDQAFELVDQFGAGIGGYQSVQMAVDQSVNGETLLIAPGHYLGATVKTEDLTVIPMGGSSGLALTLGSGVSALALGDYAAGQGATVIVNGNASGNTITANSGNDVLTGGGGYDVYKIGATFGQTVIDNFASDGTSAPQGEVDFGAGITDERLWLAQSGNDLQIDLLGSSDHLTVKDWFAGNDRAQVQSFRTADGLNLDSQVAQLVQAMATYASNNPSFDPTALSTTLLPNDPTLQNVVASAWHA
ncbi:calcium-binding protein [Mesorhizobium sp. IMUNJ 23033]|uniref:calcium-binding protein n=1 Tax=Mesorhizobium sp. IMUNJ 23033 TaxID=3378039 RepID=UPI0038503AD1